MLFRIWPFCNEKEFNVKVVGKVLDALEQMDPTKNKQYVMTLVRWYVGVIKKDRQLQAKWEDVTADDRGEDLPYPPPEDYKDLNS